MSVLELDRWCDDGAPIPPEPLTAAELGVLWADALGQFVRRLTAAMRPLLDAFRRIAESAGVAFRRFTAKAAGRWRTDVPARRWRDWLPSGDRPVDRARAKRVDRAMRARARRARRHGRVLR